MNMVYASVGTALSVHSRTLNDLKKASLESQSESFWKKLSSRIMIYTTAAMAASYYAVVGPHKKSALVTASMTESLESNQAPHGPSIDLLRNTYS